MLKRPLYETRCAAYHESGHAIAAIVLNQKFNGVTIKQSKNSWGKLEGYTDGPPLARAIVFLTGPLAQSIIFNQDILLCGTEEYYFNCGGKADFNNACVELDWIYNTLKTTKYKSYPQSYKPCKRRLYISTLNTAKEIVNNNREQIEVLAEKLIKKETIWYSTIIKILIKNKMCDSLVIPTMPKLEEV
jgi:hypothetical protein